MSNNSSDEDGGVPESEWIKDIPDYDEEKEALDKLLKIHHHCLGCNDTFSYLAALLYDPCDLCQRERCYRCSGHSNVCTSCGKKHLKKLSLSIKIKNN
jgi:hypothetical protein